MHGFILLLSLDSNYWRLGSTSQLLSSLWMTPSRHLLIPWVSGMMVSIMTFGRPCSGAKTLGWEHSKMRFWKCIWKPWNGKLFHWWISKKMGLKNNVGCLSLSWRKEEFYKKALVFLCSRSEQLTRATTLPWYGTGLSPKFVSFSAGRLIPYKGL
jgi:hypothetical protein